MPIPRYASQTGPAVLSAGFRPFFLAAALWAVVALALWLALFTGHATLPTALAPLAWHVHEMVFGYGAAVVAGFMLTAIPNWTGRLPLQGRPLAGLVLLWGIGRLGVLFSITIGPIAAAVLDLAFPAVFLTVVAREILAGRNWRNLPMVVALSLLLAGNLLVHLEPLGLAATADLGNRLGVAVLLMLISFMGGRVIPSFTRNWLVKSQPETAVPSPFGLPDRIALGLTALALALWVGWPDAAATSWAALAAGIALAVRVMRWRGPATAQEPLLWALHLGYLWLPVGFILLAINALVPLLPTPALLHALTVGAIGTVTLAMMTRVSLGHTGRGLTAGPGTLCIYGLITLAALLRLLAPLAGARFLLVLTLAGLAWCAAFGLFMVLYFPPLTMPRVRHGESRPI